MKELGRRKAAKPNVETRRAYHTKTRKVKAGQIASRYSKLREGKWSLVE